MVGTNCPGDELMLRRSFGSAIQSFTTCASATANEILKPGHLFRMQRSSVIRKLQGEFQSPESLHRKEYLAMVDGAFPETEVTVTSALTHFSVTASLQKKHREPKESVTTFRRLGFDGRTSLVHCLPQTGRTHQIRCQSDRNSCVLRGTGLG